MPVTLAVFRERLAGECASWPFNEAMTRLFRAAAGAVDSGLATRACHAEIDALVDRAWRLLDLQQVTWHAPNTVEIGSRSETALRYVPQRLSVVFGVQDNLTTALLHHIDAMAETALSQQARFTEPLQAYVAPVRPVPTLPSMYRLSVTLFVDVYVPEAVARNTPQERPFLRLPPPLTVTMPASLPEAVAFAEECFGTAKFPQEVEPAPPIDLEARRRRLPRLKGE